MGSLGSRDLATLRWGIIGTGTIASWFATDLNISRGDAQARHIIQAIGSSSIQKGRAFANTHLPSVDIIIYDSYKHVYADTNFDIIYITTPATFHKKNLLDAIAAGKHALCEKPFTITARESQEVIPRIYMKEINLVRNYTELPKYSALPLGMMLEAGVYPLTLGLLALEEPVNDKERPRILAASKLSHGIDIATSMIIHYPTSGREAILSMSTETKTDRPFCRIEGTKGHMIFEGLVGSHPESFTVFHNSAKPEPGVPFAFHKAGQVFKFGQEGWGFYYEADAVPLDIAAGRKENAIMPCSETVRVMEIIDEVRRQVGVRFSQDDR